MKEVYADLHIHIGRTKKGQAVKITGSKNLTLSEILRVASEQKGLDLIGVIDCHSPEVIEELEELMISEKIMELPEGGLRFEETTLILGSELEIYDQNCHGPIHVLAYFPTLAIMKNFSTWLSGYVKNIHLSSQRIYCDGRTLQQKVRSLDGLFIPAHVFTPFKSLYGKGVISSLSEVFDPEMIDAIELGLSSDTEMVKNIEELQNYVFLTNSDAHSLGKIAREYQKLQMGAANFLELQKVLHEIDGRKVLANYGLNPLLGKYHQTVCAMCHEQVQGAECPRCRSTTTVKGVSRRIQELSQPLQHHRTRPPYIHQIPLDFIPGLGKRTLERLLDEFQTEMNIIHCTSIEELERVLPKKLAKSIDLARKGEIAIEVGGGGKYGRLQEKSNKK